MMIKENWCWCCADHFVQWTEVLWGPGDLGTIHHEDNCYLTLAAIARHLNNLHLHSVFVTLLSLLYIFHFITI